MSSQYKTFVLIGISFVFIGIIQGAFGAHALQNYLPESSMDKSIASWKTGVLYQLIQGLGIILIVIVGQVFQLTKLKVPLILVTIGTLLFSISIYCLVLNSVWDIPVLKPIFGPMTPIGGLLMIIGWLLFGVKILKVESDNS
ncbi:MAG: uncharacterized membrane protein YgdD (TMEM256/DUF423 family) [Flavobacteriales bacterium]|jgi:uncharacterized membrane protein YgdD (TMEM256/DUF423 family)